MLDCQLYGVNPAAHHLVSLAFHSANTLLLFLLFSRMTRSTGCSVVVALLFAIHPMHVESVAWVAERKDVLSTFFGLLSLVAYVEFARGQGRTVHEAPRGGRASAEKLVSTNDAVGVFRHRALVFYSVSVGFFALSLMSKPMLVF
jgi:hypothetical protein